MMIGIGDQTPDLLSVTWQIYIFGISKDKYEHGDIFLLK